MGKALLAIVGGVVAFFALLVVFALIGAFFLKLAWSYAFTGFYYLPEPTYVQAVALNFLCGILFKSHSSVSRSK